MAEPRTIRTPRVATAAIAASLAAMLAACSPTIEYTTTLPVAPGVTLDLTLASGFRGVSDFRCRGTPPVMMTIEGNETSIDIVAGPIIATLQGGPYRYSTTGITVEFEPGYQELTVRSSLGTLNCRGPAAV